MQRLQLLRRDVREIAAQQRRQQRAVAVAVGPGALDQHVAARQPLQQLGRVGPAAQLDRERHRQPLGDRGPQQEAAHVAGQPRELLGADEVGDGAVVAAVAGDEGGRVVVVAQRQRRQHEAGRPAAGAAVQLARVDRVERRAPAAQQRLRLAGGEGQLAAVDLGQPPADAQPLQAQRWFLARDQDQPQRGRRGAAAARSGPPRSPGRAARGGRRAPAPARVRAPPAARRAPSAGRRRGRAAAVSTRPARRRPGRARGGARRGPRARRRGGCRRARRATATRPGSRARRSSARRRRARSCRCRPERRRASCRCGSRAPAASNRRWRGNHGTGGVGGASFVAIVAGGLLSLRAAHPRPDRLVPPLGRGRSARAYRSSRLVAQSSSTCRVAAILTRSG